MIVQIRLDVPVRPCGTAWRLIRLTIDLIYAKPWVVCKPDENKQKCVRDAATSRRRLQQPTTTSTTTTAELDKNEC
ncbi:hypothetical protein GEV33_010028 [Tenebrio molitor]|uniref:Uncharacterized protein n=1 Tax=Tenebrio molitor TaxID=7067 RepID=A0A8J6HDH7_TENMO|nr:hypothetical protein GEV33_010028 [Tenebrio molitor]